MKPADKVDDPKVAATLAWAGEAITVKGWAAEVWTGCDPLLLANVRFLAGYRRRWLFDPAHLDAAEAAILEGDTIGHLEAHLREGGIGEPPAARRPPPFGGRLRTELTAPLDADTAIAAAS